MQHADVLETATIANVAPEQLSPRQVGARFRRLLADGYTLRVDGRARDDPRRLLRAGYTPQYAVTLFGTQFFLCNKRDADGLRVMPGYVVPAGSGRRVHARVFYKDSSLVWRCASHYIDTPEEEWIGKGAVKSIEHEGELRYYSAEETTNLPFELQAAFDEFSTRGPRTRNDWRVLSLMLRDAPADRVWPYRDFEAPREQAMSNPANLVNGQRPVAWFEQRHDPASLRFAPGFDPDFSRLIDKSTSRSRMYGGVIDKYRFASRNRRIQYLFVHAPAHVWIVHPQTFTTRMSSYGVRTVDVVADEELFVPGYEFADNSGAGEIDDQIPPGFAGAPCPLDPDRADASPWNDRLPVVRAFRKWVARRRSAASA